MNRIYLFMMTSLDGYVEGLNRDITGFNVDEEFIDFSK